MTGPNIELYAQLIGKYPKIQLQASGGVRDINDLKVLDRIGVPAAISGRALLDGKIDSTELTTFLPAA
jgi:phosphoribosylformimino-5-aminoimidazole carboxamide ribotide isomerase